MTQNKHSKSISGGEPKKHAKEMTEEERDEARATRSEQEDRKRGNIGPSGQGAHRGRERRNRQSAASGRPDIGGAGSRPSP